VVMIPIAGITVNVVKSFGSKEVETMIGNVIR